MYRDDVCNLEVDVPNAIAVLSCVKFNSDLPHRSDFC